MIFSSLTFWTLAAGILAFVATFIFPDFPLDKVTILNVVLFLLGLIGVYPQVRARGLMASFGSLLRSLAFWEMVVGLLAFVAHFFLPDFPLDSAGILGILLFILALFNIKPELRARGLL